MVMEWLKYEEEIPDCVQAFIWRPAVGMNSSRICLSSALVLSLNDFSALIASMTWLCFVLKCSRNSFSNLPISEV